MSILSGEKKITPSWVFHKRQHVILIPLFKFVLSDLFCWLEENKQNHEGERQDCWKEREAIGHELVTQQMLPVNPLLLVNHILKRCLFPSIYKFV